MPERRRRWIVLAALAVVGAGGGVAVAQFSSGSGGSKVVARHSIDPRRSVPAQPTSAAPASPNRHPTRPPHANSSAAASTSASSSPPPPAKASPLYPAQASAAAAYATAHGMTSGVAVLDTQTGKLTTAGAAEQEFASASVVKTMIAARLLLDGEMSGHVAMLATAMITASDNDAAWALYPKVGNDGLEPWIAAHYKIEGLGGPPSMPGIWGSTQITAAGLVRFYAAVKQDPKVWPWLSNAMHHYQPTSSAGEPNAFGLATADPSAAVKNGWDTNRDPAHPTNAIVNSTGYVDGDRYAVAILSEGPGSLYYAGGEAVVTHEARLLFRSPASDTTPKPLVVLDPGHDGGNENHIAEIDRLVPAGYGVDKPCNTTGTETDAGYPEHAFTWDVVQRIKAILHAHGVRTLLTRHSDTGVGPCVNVRARIESTPGVAAAVAIHADGAPPAGHGFHVCLASRRPVGATAATVAKSRLLGTAIHDDLVRSSGLVPSTYIGTNGYFYRDDLAGLNLSTNPTAFLELGNMRNAHDAALQTSAAGRQRIAAAVAAGILAYLGR